MAKKNEKIDRDGLHVLLWQRTGRGGRLSLRSGELAAELGITGAAMSRMITSFVDAGRLRVIRRASGGPSTYVVVDPKVWFEQHPPEGER